jgi:hypothetical protein
VSSSLSAGSNNCGEAQQQAADGNQQDMHAHTQASTCSSSPGYHQQQQKQFQPAPPSVMHGQTQASMTKPQGVLRVLLHVVTFNMAGTIPDQRLPDALFSWGGQQEPDM